MRGTQISFSPSRVLRGRSSYSLGLVIIRFGKKKLGSRYQNQSATPREPGLMGFGFLRSRLIVTYPQPGSSRIARDRL